MQINVTFLRNWGLLSLICCLSAMSAFAGPGDTTVVHTIGFDDITKRCGWYTMPDESVQHEKILMYYTLKCDEATTADEFPCGEWDYLTYTYLYHPTGEMDSNLISQPSHIVANESLDTAEYSNTMAFDYWPRMEMNRVMTGLTSMDSAIVGTGTTSMSEPFTATNVDGRSQYLWTATELSAAGLVAGDITGMRFDVDGAGSELRKLTIRLKHSALATLDETNLTTTGFTTTYTRNTTFGTTGWNTLVFNTPFTWDGSSNVIVDVSFDNDGYSAGTNTTILGTNLGSSAGAHRSGMEYSLDFEGRDYVEVPAAAFAAVDDEITVSFWQYGDPDIQPQNDYVFEGRNADNQRVLNSHLPWSNSRVYWDAGPDECGGGYNRIDKEATDINFEGVWNHWAFTKNAVTGNMRIFLNGVLWHSGTGRNNPMDGITQFRIGAHAGNGGGNYDGKIDEFRVWNSELDAGTIQAWMNKEVDATHPSYANLQLYYTFNEGSGLTVNDLSTGGHDGTLKGAPNWINADGTEFSTRFSGTMMRPNAIFEQAVFASTIDTSWTVDSTVMGALSVDLYNDAGDASLLTASYEAWPIHYAYTFDAMGNVADSTLYGPDSTMYLTTSDYYDEPFEIRERYELGRFITPYGINLDLGPNGWRWVFDVTDFSTLLHGDVYLTAGNNQELLDLDFLFIEGTPPRDVLSVENIYPGGMYGLSNIDVTLPPVDVTMNPAAEMYKVRTVATGHAFDNPTNCAEFCNKTHSFSVNGFTAWSWEIMQECADNPLYPQGGTWIYDRAGWCPGAPGRLEEMEITPFVSPGATATLDYNSQLDTYGNYRFEAQLVSYGPANHALDAAIQEIIAPNDWELKSRINPVCKEPIITIQNTGSDILTSVDITYGMQGGTMFTYNWTGSLAFLAMEEVTLPDLVFDGTANVFTATVSNPNGGTDEYAFNNTVKSSFDMAPVFPSEFIFRIRTNSAVTETKYTIKRADGATLYLESPFWGPNMVNDDFISLPNGCYELRLYDTGDDGLEFFANSDGNGWAQLLHPDETLFFEFEPNFGKEFIVNFTVTDSTVAIDDGLPNDAIEVYPNPAVGNFTVEMFLARTQNVEIEVFSSMGKRVYQSKLSSILNKSVQVDMSEFPAGVYFAKIRTERGEITEKVLLVKE